MTPRAVVIVINLAFLAWLSSLCQLFTAAAISSGLLYPHIARKILSVSLFQVLIYILWVRPTDGVTRKWAGVDSVWEQEKLEARKMLINRADSHTSGARFVRPHGWQKK